MRINPGFVEKTIDSWNGDPILSEKKKSPERDEFSRGLTEENYEWGYKWHVSYPMNTYKLPHCSMSSIFSCHIV
jgi:hypothetical protein